MTWPTTNPLSKEIEEFWLESQSLWQQWQYEADLDTKMATGQQDYWNTFYNINYRNQKILMFNKILRIINMIGGYQRDNRLATIVQPADNDPDRGHTADQLSKVLQWCMRQDQTYEKISDCFEGAITCGLNLMQVWMDYREDPENGIPRTDRIPFNGFIMDNFWTKPDLSDCDRILTRRYITKKQLHSLFPKLDKDLPNFGRGFAAKDGKFPFLSQNWNQYSQDLFAYDEYWTRDYRKGKKVLDTSTGEVIDWKGTRDQFRMFRQYNPNIELITAMIPTIKLHVLVNNNLIYEEKSPYGIDRFPFVPFCCYHYPEVQNYSYRYQGVVRNIRDSQVELNRRRNRMLDILDAQVQSGLMIKEDALVNPEDAFSQGPGKVLYFKNTANLAMDVLPIPAPPVAAGWEELIGSIEKEIMDIVGPEELFAQNMGAKEMTGILMKLKQGAGLIGLRNIFDRLNQSQMYLGEIMLEMIQKNFSMGKVGHIIGEEPTEEFDNSWETKYHATIEEAELTSTQRQLQFMQALQLKQMGLPVPTRYLLEKSSLQGKKELIDSIEQEEQQQQQMQQAQSEAELAQQQMMARSLEAKSQSDFAAAIERKARAVSDIALAKERSSQAVHDRSKAALENAKALKELQELDENRLIKLAEFITEMQLKQKQIQGGEEGDSLQEAMAVGSEVSQAEQSSRTSPGE